MIEEFSFGNFWSFKDIQTLNMTAAKIKSTDSELDLNNVINLSDKLNLLKSKAIYGANASGKSSIIKALIAFIRIVKESVKDENALYIIDSFKLSTETIGKPTFFQLILRIDNVKYRYGFEADDKSIKSEWLYFTPKLREQNLFIRENGKIISINQAHFKEGSRYIKLMEGDSEEQIFRNNSLFISSLAAFGFGKISKNVVTAITSITIINGLGHQGMYSIAGSSLDDSIMKDFILKFLKKADTGIEAIESIEINQEDLPENIREDIKKDFEKSNKKIIVSSRYLYNENLKKEGLENFSFLVQESEGTKKMFELSPFIYKILKEGGTLVIDEFDSRFHPLLTKNIVELFNSPENSKSQLIFITHDTNLLSSNLLRRDQIDFVEKDKYGASHLYTLVEIKGVRNNASFEKDYIQGKYGAIPFLGNFNKLLNIE